MADSTPKPLYVPIDIGENVTWYAGSAAQVLGVVAEPHRVRTERTGYAAIRGWLAQQLSGGQDARLVVGHEPTWIYHEGSAYALQ